MNKDEYLTWVNYVSEHMNALDRIVEDRKLLKSAIESHLKQFFDWDEIEYNRDFSVITLTLNYSHIRISKISELMMDFCIKPHCGYDNLEVEVYPFGVPNNHEIYPFGKLNKGD